MFSALKEAQDSVRSYDTKAQIIGVGFIFTIGILTKLGANLPGEDQFGILAVILFWVIAIGPIILFGFVVYPSRKFADHLAPRDMEVRENYYVSGEGMRNLDSYIKDIEASNWIAELAHEIMKVSYLRDLKRIRFVRALRVSALSLVLIAIIQILRTIGFNIVGS